MESRTPKLSAPGVALATYGADNFLGGWRRLRRSGQLRAFWLDHDWFRDNPDADEYVRPRIAFEFGEDDASDDPEWGRYSEASNAVQWVLVRRMGEPTHAWIRAPLAEAFPQPWSGAREDFGQWRAGRPAATA